MWYIILAFACLLIGGLVWVLQPYFVWKKHFRHHDKDSITIRQTTGYPLQLSAFL